MENDQPPKDGRKRRANTSFPRIAKPIELIQVSYDCVVVGSGYGGGVAASRMARAGQSVCLLERGRERWPGEYPVSFSDALKQFHISGDSASIFFNNTFATNSQDPTGMYHVVSGRGQNALVCNGLGGTSLINANVFLEADADTLAMEFWPPEIRDNPGCLTKYYEKVKTALEPEPYPDHLPTLKKTEVLKRQAEVLGLSDKFYKVPQTTRFRQGPNSSGVHMSTSTLTGQDSTGINDGSKTTTLVTYLADAWNWGAEMFCQCEVRYIEKVQDARGGYLVYFAWHGRHRGILRDNIYGNLMWVHAKSAVFLGAGAIGTTEILLRSKSMSLGMSDWVGQGMSGNGDMLTFGYNTDVEVNAIGKEHSDLNNPVGPTINAIIDNRTGHDNPLHGFVVEEGAIPQGLSQFMQVVLDLMPGSHSPKQTPFQRVRAAIRGWRSRLLGPYTKNGAMQMTQVFLIMSHDSSQATLGLRNDKPVLEFLGVGQSDRVNKLNALLTTATNAVGGTLVQTPFYALMGDQQITVHPLGGARMSLDNNGRNGATNHRGEVFVGSNTSETHPGLIVTDGALIPAALGVNPLATIAALAERAVAEYATGSNLAISDEENGTIDLFGQPARSSRARMREDCHHAAAPVIVNDQTNQVTDLMRTSEHDIQFTELLSGFFFCHNSIPEIRDGDAYERAYHEGKCRGEGARLFLTAKVFGVGRAQNYSQPRGVLTGTFVCPTIKGSPFMVLRGNLDFFKPDPTRSGTCRLTYEFDMTGINGRRLRFFGYKVIDSSVTLNLRQLWRSTTTLYVEITELDPVLDEPSELYGEWTNIRHLSPVAMGIMHLRPVAFGHELLSLTPSGDYMLEKAVKTVAFLVYFACHLLYFFLTPLMPLQYPTDIEEGHINPTPATQTFAIEASDGVCTELHMWAPESENLAPNRQGTSVATKNLFMIPGGAVDHQIYALPTIPVNAVNYFTRAGYRVFVTTHRIGRLSTAREPWTTYDARLDIKACLEHIRRMYDNQKVYTIAHCLGSVAFASGLLDGTIPADWILGITCSQVFMNPVWSTPNRMKAASPIPPDRLYGALAGSWFDCRASRHANTSQQTLDQTLRFYPVKGHEVCNSATCHRITMLFGRCWNHGNLNEATHRHMDRFFGGANMTLMDLLMRMDKHVRSNDPAFEDLVTDENVGRLRGIPILLFVGGDNAVLSPIATEMTYERLCESFGVSAGSGKGIQYRRRVVPGYGHLDCWMGREAWRDVFPFVREEVDRVVRGESHCVPSLKRQSENMY